MAQKQSNCKKKLAKADRLSRKNKIMPQRLFCFGKNNIPREERQLRSFYARMKTLCICQSNLLMFLIKDMAKQD